MSTNKDQGQTSTSMPEKIKVSELIAAGKVFINDPNGRATVVLADGQVVDERMIAQYSEIYERSVLHCLKELSKGNGCSLNSEISVSTALELLQTFSYTQNMAQSYNDAATDMRMTLYCNALHATLAFVGVSEEEIAAAHNTPCDRTGITDYVKGFKCPLGRVVTHTRAYSGIPLWRDFEGKLEDERRAKQAAEAAMTEEQRHAHRMQMIRDAHERVKARAATAGIAQEAAKTQGHDEALPNADHNSHQIDIGVLQREAKQALDDYRLIWKEVANRIQPITVESLTGSKAAAPYIRLDHQDFLKQFDTVLQNAKEYGLIRKIDNTGAKHASGSMIELLSSLKRAHYTLETSRRAVEMFSAQDLPNH